ncbi:MAG: hypothetical protein M1436_05710 [Acidobacteria bacterium]|nr:hypothetical protein [Acidobacteriota bacterium]
MRIFGGIGLYLTAVICGAATPQFTPPTIPAGKPAPRVEKLLRNLTRYTLSALPSGEIRNESEHAIRPLAGTAYAAAVCLKFADCEAPAQTRETVIRVLRELTRTHVSGGGHTASGQPWGNHWQSAFWAYEAAFAGWLLWPDLPPDVREGVVRMTVHEADRFMNMPPPAAEFLDTKAEENGWNAMVQVLAAEALPGHPHAPAWRRQSHAYMISAFATRADARSARLVDGRPLRQWTTGANIHNDFTLENHGFVHPDYMTTVSENLTNAVVYRLLGRPVPQAVLHNARPVYENLKVFTLPDGGFFYPNSTDWTLHQIAHSFNLHVLMERIAGDRESAALAECALNTLEKMQVRNANGRLWLPGEYSTYPGSEQHAAVLIAGALMAEKLWPAAANPMPLDLVWKHLEGVRAFDDARLFVVRTPHAISSFAWGLRIMGLTAPFDRDPIVNPLNHSYFGLTAELGNGDQPGRMGVVSAAMDRALAQDAAGAGTVIVSREAGAVSVTGNAQHGRLSQGFSFTVLPSGKSVYTERYDGGDSPVEGGLISLLEEPGWVYGVRDRHIERGREWLNVDDRLGFVVSGSGGFAERRDYHTRTLLLNENPTRGSICVIVTLPNATAAQTRAMAAQPVRAAAADPAIAAAVVDGLLVVSNLSVHPITTTVEAAGRKLPVAVTGWGSRVLRVGGI